MNVDPLLPELVQLQHRDGYLRPEALQELSQRLAIPVTRIYSVASFYQAFRFRPSGKHAIQVCVGAACYVKGAETVYEAFARHLQIPDGSDTSPDGLFTLSRVACLGCCMLAVAAQMDRHIFGHVTTETVPVILRDFLKMTQDEKEVESPSTTEPFSEEIRICLCSSCRAAGSDRIYRAIEREMTTHDFDVTLKTVSCTGMSYRTPLVTVATEEGFFHYDRVREHEIPAILANHFVPKSALGRIFWKGRASLDHFYRRKGCQAALVTALDEEIAKARLITQSSGMANPESIAEYRDGGGFQAFLKALRKTPEEILALLERSKLRGRGGGGFPTGTKWRLACEASGDEKVVVCNADEGDPGAFMDRMLLESYPYRVLEGMLIAARVTGAKKAYVYVREEYAQAVRTLQNALSQLRQMDVFRLLGNDFEITLFQGAGAFVCGEETALLESMEGRRGIPRRRPPFPVTAGLFGKPTLINNVETFACVPMILQDDGAAFHAIGTPTSHGTKAFALAGKVRRGGLIEVPIGISIREIVEKFGGGAEEGHEIKAVMIGGPSGGCISQRYFDLPVDYESLQARGAMMGSGGLIVLDERDCMVDIALYYLRFLRGESCGKCVPCREGVDRLCRLVEQLTHNLPQEADLLEKIVTLGKSIQQGALCALGRTAPNMVLSAIQEFRGEFEAHLKNRCPAGKCAELTEFRITNDCIGCTRCVQACAAGAIVGEPLDRARILPEKCVRCGVCRTVCPQHAIRNVGQEAENEPERAEILQEKAPPVTVEGNFVQIDGQKYPFEPNRTLKSYDDRIPTLCWLSGVNEKAHCMVCAVWDATLGRFVPGCEQWTQLGHVYETTGEKVRHFRQEMLSLLLARHDFRCGQCGAKADCRLLEHIREYRVKKEPNLAEIPAPIRGKHLIFEAGKCVLCHRCQNVSRDWLTIHHRGIRSIISPEPYAWDDIPPEIATEICAVCPTGAMSRNSEGEGG